MEKNLRNTLKNLLYATYSEDLVTKPVYSFTHIAVLKPVRISK